VVIKINLKQTNAAKLNHKMSVNSVRITLLQKVQLAFDTDSNNISKLVYEGLFLFAE